MSPKTYLYMVFVFSQQRLSITIIRRTVLIFRSKGSWTNLGVKRSKVMTINFECVLYFIDKLIMTIWWPWFFNLKITRFIPLLFQCPTTICMANLKCKSLKNISSWHSPCCDLGRFEMKYNKQYLYNIYSISIMITNMNKANIFFIMLHSNIFNSPSTFLI